MKNNGIDKNNIYFYPDGIYLREEFKGYSYPKQVLPIDLKNVSALADYLEKGQPSDEFRTVLDSENYAKYHKVPWKVINKLMEGVYYTFQQHDNEPGAVLFGFLFQKFSSESQIVNKRDADGNIEYELDNEGQPKLDSNGNQIPVQVLDNRDDFKIVIPEQTLNNPSLSTQLISNDAELQSYLSNDEYIYVGQFLFVNYDPNDNGTRQVDIALRNMPQNIYVFNHYSSVFNFAANFGGLQTLPVFNQINNGKLNRRELAPRQVYNYLSIPIDVKQNTGRVGINNDIDMSEFATKVQYIYYDGELGVEQLLNRASDEDKQDFQDWSNHVRMDNSTSMDDALAEADAQNNTVTPDVTTQNQVPSDVVNKQPTPQATQPQFQTQASSIPEEQPVVDPTSSNDDNGKVKTLSEDDLLGGNNDTGTANNTQVNNGTVPGVENTQGNLASTLNDDDLLQGIASSFSGANTTATPESSAQDNSATETAQDIIDHTPADQRFITNQDGNPVFYATSKKRKSSSGETPSAADRQHEAYVDHTLKKQNDDLMSRAKKDPELDTAMQNLLRNHQ